MKYGYARVSTKEQDETRQVELLMKNGVEEDKIFIEKKSGKDFKNRSIWKNLLAEIEAEDIITVTSLDRLGRNYEEVTEMYKKLIRKNIKLEVLDFPILSTTGKKGKGIEYKLIQEISLAVLSYVAENERKNLKKRQREAYNNLERDKKGRLISRKKGVVCGRPNVIENLNKRQKEQIQLWIDKKLKLKECIELTKLSRATLYRIKEKWLTSEAKGEKND